MKILIWIGCFLVFSILQVGYKHSGILLGAIPTALLAMGGFWLTWRIAKKLCNKWDQRKTGKQDEKPSTSNDDEIEDIPVTQDDTLLDEEMNDENTRHPKRFCSKCGNEIDPTTMKCTGCGKQYFNGFKYHLSLIFKSIKHYLPIIFNKGNTLSIILSVMLIISVVCNIVQAVYTSDRIDSLIRELNNAYDTQDNYLDYYAKAKSKLYFYERHVVFVSDDGTNLYHKCDCEDFDDSSFWAFNTEQAKSKGYVAHKKCCG